MQNSTTQSERQRKFRFSQRELEALSPHDLASASRELELCDQEVVGLRFMVSKTGRKFFDLRYRVNGRRRVIRIGEFPAVTLKEARQRANDLKNQVSRGIDPLVEKRTRTSIPTFEEFADEYMVHAKSAKRSWRDDEIKLQKELTPRFGRRQLTAITTKDVQLFHNAIRAEHAPATANRYLTLLQRMLALAVQWGYLERNVARGVRKLRENNVRERYLSNEEMTRLLDALNATPNRVMAGAIRFLLSTGLRKGEALSLRWDDVDLERDTIFLTKTKSGKSRTALLNAVARQVLDEMLALRPEGHPYVFPGREPGAPVNNPSKAFKAALTAAGISNFRIHDLRHSFASTAINAGATLYDVQKLLGHASSQMTQRYAHLADSSLRRATESVASKITAATK